jgi:DNA processing protein
LEEKIYQLALYLLPGVGDVLFKQLISYCGSAEKVFQSPVSKLKRIPGIGEKITSSLKNSSMAMELAKREFQNISNIGGQILIYNDPFYPSRLREINDSPPILFYSGNADLNNSKILSIVGTRNATEYGKEAVSEIIEGLKPHNPLIISGLAYGIDICAHRQALKHGLDTVGIMASGLDIIYPFYHRKTSEAMKANGGLITEHPIGTKPEAPYFPARNRIIAGMSDAVIVIEAANRGGALITAELANGYDREVFAVPGNLHSQFSEGCNKLIRSHKANILTSHEDIEYLMGWSSDSSENNANTPLTELLNSESLEENSKLVISILQQKSEGLTIDELSWQSQIPVNQIASELLTLEFMGIISSLPGKKYKLIG